MKIGSDTLLGVRDHSNRWELEWLESRVLLNASALGTAANDSAVPAALAHPTLILEGISPDINSPPTGAFIPSQINSAYDFNQVLFGSVQGSGSGQTVAIIDAYDDPTALNDLNQFSLQFSLPLMNQSGEPTFTQVGETGGSVPGTDPAGAGNDTWELEESLDIEWVHAIAPQANIILVEAVAPTFSDLVQTAVPWAASQPGVVAVSMSFSGGEFSSESSYDSCFTTPSGHAGVTFLASTGDDGEPAGYPAYSPNVIAVGGTSLTLSGSTYQGEFGWSGSGGGISAFLSERRGDAEHNVSHGPRRVHGGRPQHGRGHL
jgi:subtilase family serine protease